MQPVSKNRLKITKCEVLGALPELLTFEDGTPVKEVADWDRRRKELYKTAIELQYGTMPPPPEFLEVELTYIGNTVASYRIYTGTRAHPVSFLMKLVFPKEGGPFPCIVDGDMCFPYHMNKEYLSAATDRGVAWVLFDRTELAHDLQGEGRGKGQLYDAYPDYTFGSLGAWAWGYSRCVDALEILSKTQKEPTLDLSLIAFCGHSRGGKTAILAGALDERAALVNPNETCAGACSCYRIHMNATYDGLSCPPSETLENITAVFPHWFGPDLVDYATKEAELPFDSHFLKAMIAPRVLFVSEAAGDIWANPVGSWATTMAAKRAFEFLGVPENLFWYYREGYHFHEISDVKMLVSILKHMQDPENPLEDGFFVTPFEEDDPILEDVRRLIE